MPLKRVVVDVVLVVITVGVDVTVVTRDAAASQQVLELGVVVFVADKVASHWRQRRINDLEVGVDVDGRVVQILLDSGRRRARRRGGATVARRHSDVTVVVILEGVIDGLVTGDASSRETIVASQQAVVDRHVVGV